MIPYANLMQSLSVTLSQRDSAVANRTEVDIDPVPKLSQRYGLYRRDVEFRFLRVLTKCNKGEDSREQDSHSHLKTTKIDDLFPGFSPARSAFCPIFYDKAVSRTSEFMSRRRHANLRFRGLPPK